MNILVIDVAASESGAVTILKDYHKKYSEDKDNRYFFCVSTVELNDTENITVLPFRWVKKSWIHRLWFDYIVSGKLIKKYKIDKIVSLQNTLIPTKGCNSSLYLHMSLPFVEYRYRLVEEPLFWVYQKIIYLLIRRAVRKADQVIVQTKWMRIAVAERCKVSEDKIIVESPECNVKPTGLFNIDNWDRSFFYPATNYSYKNHIVIFQAIKKMVSFGVSEFKVYLTLEENEIPENCKELFDDVKTFVVCEGKLPHEEVMKRYSKSVLLFPSFIETFGLPLLEARMCNDYIIAADTPFANEILERYDKVCFFEFSDSETLAQIMKNMLEVKE